MKHLLTLFACFLAMSLSAQSNQADCLSAYDGNGDGHINVNDLLGLLSFFDTQDLDGGTPLRLNLRVGLSIHQSAEAFSPNLLNFLYFL